MSTSHERLRQAAPPLHRATRGPPPRPGEEWRGVDHATTEKLHDVARAMRSVKRATFVACMVAMFGLAGCDRIDMLTVHAQVRGATLEALVADLRNLDQRANLTREMHWRVYGKVPAWDKLALIRDDGADAKEPFRGAITSFGAADAPNSVSIDVTLREKAGNGEIEIKSGGIGVTDERIPKAAMERVFARLKAMYGEQNVRMCHSLC